MPTLPPTPIGPPLDPTSDTCLIPIEAIDGIQVATVRGGVGGEGSFADFRFHAPPMYYPFTITWKVLAYVMKDSGVTATLRIYDGWLGNGNMAESGSLSAGLQTISISATADQILWLQWALSFGGTGISAVVNKTGGAGNVSVTVLQFDAQITGWYGSDALYTWGYPAPTNFTVSGTWVTVSGPPMQGEAVTLLYQAYGRYAHLVNPEKTILRVAHAFTDGGGGFTFSYRDWGLTAWVLPGWWYQERVAGVFRILPVKDIANLFHPGNLGHCTTPWISEGYSPCYNVGIHQYICEMAGFARFPGPLSGSYGVGTIETDYVPKIHAIGGCGEGGRYNLGGITFDVIGAFGTETVTTDGNGVAYLTQVDPQAILDIDNVTGLPSCADLNDETPYVLPGGLRRGVLSPNNIFTGASSLPQGAQYGAWRIPPACGDNWWEGYFSLCTDCGGDPMPSMRLNADVHEPTGSIAVAWINDSGALKVSVNPQPGTCIEQENGGLGWTPPVTLESANASDVGLAFLADGTLFVCYDLSGAKKFRTNKLLGMGTLSDWTAAATPSPSVSRHSDQGRAQRQAFRFRATGGTPNPWQGSGNIEFSQARLNTDAWTSPITIVTGSRGIFAGGSWIGQGYGCLYTRESDGLVYWKTTDNPDVWPAGFGTQIAEISLMPISLARHPSGSLCAITWDATGTTKCRAAYSHGRGEAWEESAADIPVIPPLTQPPMIVCSGGNFYAIWVANDQVMCAFSTDGGVTWAG